MLTIISPVVITYTTANIPVISRYIAQWPTINQEPLQEPNRRININKNIEILVGELVLSEVVMSPGKTILKLSYTNNKYNDRGATIRFPDCELVNSGKSIKSLCGHASGTMHGNTWEEDFSLEFQGLDAVPAILTFRVNACLYSGKETIVPLEPGKTTIAANGLPIAVSSLEQKNRHGKAVVSYPINHNNQFPFDIMYWQVRDDEGKLHPTNAIISNRVLGFAVSKGTTGLQTNNKSSDHSSELEWELPGDQTAVALVNSGCWEYHENLDIIRIEIPDNQ